MVGIPVAGLLTITFRDVQSPTTFFLSGAAGEDAYRTAGVTGVFQGTGYVTGVFLQDRTELGYIGYSVGRGRRLDYPPYHVVEKVFGKVHDMVIMPPFRRVGVGRRTYEHAESIMRSAGTSAVYLEAFPSAVPFWLRMGYSHLAYYLGAVYMVKRFPTQASGLA